MITLKLNPYSVKEIKLLAKLLADMEDSISNKYCETQGYCKTCEYRNICYDVEHAKIYAKKIYKEMENKK